MSHRLMTLATQLPHPTDVVASPQRGIPNMLSKRGATLPPDTIPVPQMNVPSDHKVKSTRNDNTKVDAAQQQQDEAARALQKKDDAERKDTLRKLTHSPYNAETPNPVLQQNFYTPQKDFYVRSHLPMPHLDPAKFHLSVAGEGLGMELSFAELKHNFANVERAIVVQCGGNRRSEMNRLKETRGLKWKQGCIGNAMWQGVLLAEVLAKAGVNPQCPAGAHQHVIFESVDGYSVSVPTSMVFSRDCVLAWGMNGEPLSRAHGAPLRVVIPGVIGARSAKYVAKLRLSPQEAQTPWQRGDYKLLPPNVGFKQMLKAFAAAPPIMDMPVQSCVLTPEDGDSLPEGAKSVKAVGYAYSGGGRAIRRVDISSDGGMTWQQADLHTADGTKPSEEKADWSWVFWSADVPLPQGGSSGGVHTLTCKATNTANDTQPETARGIWNVRGLCNNSWQQVRLREHQDPSLLALSAAGEVAKGAQLGIGSL